MSGDYCNYLIDLLASWGAVTARRMFGGYGFYRGDVIFGIMVDDVLYFKVGDSNHNDYEIAGSAPFTYEAKGKRATMSYWQVPVEVVDDQETLCTWAEKAYAVAVYNKASKPRKRTRKTRS